MKFLTTCFLIDVCAYAVLSNHYHLVLRVNTKLAKTLTNQKIIEHWTRLYPNTKKLNELKLFMSSQDEANKQKAQEIIEDWREKLTSIGHLMQALNQKISYRSNKEMDKKGHFWDGRYNCQALLDNTALLTCMAYVDLNPIRAGITDSLEQSDFTSIQERIKTFRKHLSQKKANKSRNDLAFQPSNLAPIGSENSNSVNTAINCTLNTYFELVDSTGRIIRADKKGFIPQESEKLLSTLNLDNKKWLMLVMKFEEKFARFAGDSANLHEIAIKYGRKYCKGQTL